METGIREQVDHIRKNIAAAALRTGRRPEDVRLMAVTKTVADDRIREAVEAGVDIIGENYVQEARRKMERAGRSDLVDGVVAAATDRAGGDPDDVRRHGARLLAQVAAARADGVDAATALRAALADLEAAATP